MESINTFDIMITVVFSKYIFYLKINFKNIFDINQKIIITNQVGINCAATCGTNFYPLRLSAFNIIKQVENSHRNAKDKA